MDNVSGQRDRLYIGAICNHNMTGYVTGQVRVLITQLLFVNHYVLFVVRRGNVECSQLVE